MRVFWKCVISNISLNKIDLALIFDHLLITVRREKKISGYFVNEYWHLNAYRYLFYRFVLESFCAKRLTKPCVMLDAGCGPTICSLSKVPRNVSVVGVDLSYQNIARSNNKAKIKGYNNFNFLVASLTSLPLRSDIFDLVVSVDVLEHIDDKRNVMTEISRTLKPKGEFVSSTTNILNPIMQFDSCFPRISKYIVKKLVGEEQYERAGRFSLCKLSQTLKKAFFVLSDVKLVGFPPFEPWLYEYSAKKLEWYAYVWIVFDKLTRKKPLAFLKEVIVFHAVKIP